MRFVTRLKNVIFLKKRGVREYVWAGCFSFFAVFFQFVGMYLHDKTELSSSDVLISILFSIIPAGLLLLLLLWMKEGILCRSEMRALSFEQSDWQVFLFCFGVICLCWIPYFLAYYPGIMSYDVRHQVFQHIEGYNSANPLIHTLMLQGCISLGVAIFHDGNAGAAIYTIIQMLLVTAALAYMLLFLYRAKVSRVIQIILLVFASVFPVWPIMAMSATKDVVFGACFLVSCVCIGLWCLKPELVRQNRLLILFCVSSVFAILFRVSAIVSIGAAFVGSLMVLKGKLRIKMLICCGITMLLGSGAVIGLNVSTHASPGDSNESMNIPLQQIALTVSRHREELREDEIYTIYELIPDIDAYDPYRSDNIKYTAEANLSQNKQFLKLYLKLMYRYPGDYLAAWMKTTQGLWYIWDISSTQIYGSGVWEGGGVGYLLTDMHKQTEEFGIQRVPLFSRLFDFCQNLVNANTFIPIPGVRLLFSLGLYFWLAMMALMYTIINRHKHAVMCWMYIGVYMVGLLFCPCVLVRYCFPFIICVPVLFTLAFRTRQ